METLELIIIWFTGLVLGYQMCIWNIRRMLKDEAHRLGLELDKPSKIVPTYFIEYENGQYYMYDTKASKFHGQASSIDGLAANLKQSKQIDFAIAVETIGNIQKYWVFKDGKSEPANLNEG